MKYVRGYWIFLLSSLILEALTTLFNENVALLFIGLIWLVAVVGIGFESEQFTSYYKQHFPLEYAELLKRRDFRGQFTFSPPNNEELRIKQIRMKNYLRFTICAGFLPAIVFLLIQIGMFRRIG